MYFIATSRLTHLTPYDLFGTGFTLHLLAAESWINYTRLVACRSEFVSRRNRLLTCAALKDAANTPPARLR